MSDIRTLNLPDVSPFETLLGMVDDLAADCAERMSLALPDGYHGRQSTIDLGLTLEDEQPDGTVVTYRSGPIIISGWSLHTVPYFISNDRSGYRPSVFITGTRCQPSPINRYYLQYRARGVRLFPRISELREVHEELLEILTS